MFGSHSKELVDRDKLYAKSVKRRGSFFLRKRAFLEASEKDGINLSTATPEQINTIKLKIKAQKIAEKKRLVKILIASVIFGLILFAAISWLIRKLFF